MSGQKFDIFDHMCDLDDPKCDLEDMDMGLARDTSSHDGKHLYQVVLKSTNKQQNYGADTNLTLCVTLMTPSVTLTLKIWTWVLCAIHRLMIVNICTTTAGYFKIYQ